jgi:hypothetical protein
MNDKVKAMYADGYNVNQIAAIFMISQAEVNAILDGPVVVESPKSKKVDDTPTTAIGQPKIESTGTEGQVGWLNEENI